MKILCRLILIILIVFILSCFFDSIRIFAQALFFPSLPQIKIGGDYGTMKIEEDDEEWEEYIITKLYAQLNVEVFKDVFYIVEGYYAKYDYTTNDNNNKNVWALYNYIRIKAFPKFIINLIVGYKSNDYISPSHADFSFFKIGANLKYRFAKYSYFYISYAYYDRDALTDYKLQYLYMSLSMPLWLINFSIYTKFDYKVYTNLSSSFKFMIGFDLTFDLNYLVKE